MSAKKTQNRGSERAHEGLANSTHSLISPDALSDEKLVTTDNQFSRVSYPGSDGPKFGPHFSNKLLWAFKLKRLDPYHDGVSLNWSDYGPENDPTLAVSNFISDTINVAKDLNFDVVPLNDDKVKCFVRREDNTFVAFRLDIQYKLLRIGIGVSCFSPERAIELSNYYNSEKLEALPELILSLKNEFNVPASMSKDAANFLRSTIKHELRRFLEERLPVPQEKYDGKSGDVVAFIQEKWSQWLECDVLSMPVLMRHDEPAYGVLQRWLKKGNRLPAGMNIPSKHQILIDEIGDPDRVREARRIGRAAERLLSRDP